jgi:hypothetical protein
MSNSYQGRETGKSVRAYAWWALEMTLGTVIVAAAIIMINGPI